MLGTKFPNIMPMAMAKNIHTARNRSSNPMLLNADCLDGLGSVAGLFGCCSSISGSKVEGIVRSETDCSLLACSVASVDGDILYII